MKMFIYRYGSICEPDVIESFKRLGFDVTEEVVEITNKKILPSEAIKIVSEKLTADIYSFVFTINFFPWLSDVCNILKLPYISLIVDSPVLELYSKALYNPCNRIFYLTGSFIENLHQRTLTVCSIYLLQLTVYATIW